MGLQTLCVAAFQIGGQFLTDFYFPSDIFEELRECWGEFDNVQDRYDPANSENDNTPDKKDEDDTEEDNDEKENNKNDKDTNDGEGGDGEGEGDDDKGKEEEGGEEEEEEEPMYQECVDNSTNFYISFAQYLILAVVFCTGKPFKKSIFYNYGMLIFSIIGFIYAEYIVFYVDKFSSRWIYITAYPDDPFLKDNYYQLDDKALNSLHSFPFKYIIMIFIVANFVCCLFIEKVIVPFCYRKWRKMKMKKLKRQIELDVDKESNLKLINTVKNYIREKKKA